MKLMVLFPKLTQFLSTKKRFIVTVTSISFVVLVSSFILFGQKDDPQSLLRDGIHFKDTKDLVKARSYFKKILDRYPASSPADQAAYYYAISFYMEQDCTQTISGFQHLVQKYSESVWVPEAYYHIGLCNRNLGKKEEANQNFKYIVDNFQTTVWAGYSKERLSEKAPSNATTATAQNLFGEAINDFNHDQCTRVKENVRQIIARFPGFSKMDQSLAIYALCYYKEKNFPEAINVYSQLLKNYPKSPLVPEGYYHIALSNQFLKRTAEAKKNYLLVIENFPESEWARYSREGVKNLK